MSVANRGVFIPLWVITAVKNDLTAALLFSQILWWFSPGDDDAPRASYERDGHRWLVRPDDGWNEECVLTLRQIRRARTVLVRLGLVEHRRFKVRGAPTSAWRPLVAGLEVTRSRHFHGTDLSASLPTDASGSVPFLTASDIRTTPAASGRGVCESDIETVWQAWVSATGRTGHTKRSSKRIGCITRALRTYDVADVVDAVKGWRHSPHHRGDTKGVAYNDIAVLLRDSSQIEFFRNLERQSRPRAQAQFIPTDDGLGQAASLPHLRAARQGLHG